jgi:hypothetical protein
LRLLIATAAPLSLVATAHGASSLFQVKTHRRSVSTIVERSAAPAEMAICQTAKAVHNNGQTGPRLNDTQPHADRGALTIIDDDPTSASYLTDVVRTLIRDGVITDRIVEERAAYALSLWDRGEKAPNVIARKARLHRDTVTKLIDGYEDLLAGAKIRA